MPFNIYRLPLGNGKWNKLAPEERGSEELQKNQQGRLSTFLLSSK